MNEVEVDVKKLVKLINDLYELSEPHYKKISEEQKLNLDKTREELKKEKEIVKEKNLLEFTKEQRISLLKCLDYKTEDMSDEEIKEISSRITMQDLADKWNELSEPQEPTIDQLKKQIKYSKNPLEVKMLNKQLNEMYKEMKRR